MNSKLPANANAAQGPSFIAKGPLFVRECVEELKKVDFPNRQQTMQATMVTLFIMVFVALVLFVLDVVFKHMMEALV
jgi:preprotein translocase subunit SecE